MQVLFLDNDARRHEAVMTAFIKAGFLITATSSTTVAHTFLECGAVDLLITTEELNGRLSHGTVLLAEHRNPALSTIMITDRTGEDVDELYQLIPSVHCIVGSDVSASTILTLGRASVASNAPKLPFGSALAARRSAAGKVQIPRAA